MDNTFIRQYGITKDGVSYAVEMCIDIDALATEIINDAVINKSGKASKLGGLVTAKVIHKVDAARAAAKQAGKEA